MRRSRLVRIIEDILCLNQCFFYSSEIVIDPTVNRPCDVFLTSVDVQQGGNVQYNFFRIQVWLLFYL